MFQAILHDIQEWLFPHFCSICGKKSEDIYLCEDCISAMPKMKLPLCPQCGQEQEDSVGSRDNCPECLGLLAHYDFARSLFKRDDHIRQLILGLKYGHQAQLAHTLASLLPRLAEQNPELNQKDWFITFVPMTYSRTMKRGYNQSQELAKTYAKSMQCELVSLLKREKDDKTHTLMTRKERLSHAHIVYKLDPKKKNIAKYKGKKILLIDDVFTTGATAQACAKQLRKTGFSRIGILTLMRA